MVPCIWRWLAILVLHAKAGSAKVHLADRAAPSAMWYIASIWHLTHPMIIHAPVIIVPTHLPIALGNVIATCTAIVGSEARQADPLPPPLGTWRGPPGGSLERCRPRRTHGREEHVVQRPPFDATTIVCNEISTKYRPTCDHTSGPRSSLDAMSSQ